MPGAAGAWCDAAERWGSLPLATLLEPAVRLAEEGFPVTPITAYSWKRQEPALRQQHIAQGGGTPGLLVADPSAPGGLRAPCAARRPSNHEAPRTRQTRVARAAEAL